jgi:hypothetical protein
MRALEPGLIFARLVESQSLIQQLLLCRSEPTTGVRGAVRYDEQKNERPEDCQAACEKVPANDQLVLALD